jgi:hypothetical protein
MAVKKLLVFSVSLLIISGAVLAGQTIIQKGSVITDVFNATSLFVEKISGYQLKGDIDASGNLVKNLADPVNQQDAATKAYVDAKAGPKGLICEGIKATNHQGDNIGCNATAAFSNIAVKLSGSYSGICPDYESAKRFCQEEGYSDTAGYSTRSYTVRIIFSSPSSPLIWDGSKWRASSDQKCVSAAVSHDISMSTITTRYINVLFCK